MKKSKIGCLSLLAFFAIAIAGIFIADKILPSKAVRLLPNEATEINEFYWDAGFTGDFVRQVKAKVKREFLEDYAKKVGAMDTAETKKESPLSFSSGETWWNPPRNPIYSKQDGDYHVLVGWKDGYIYFEARAH